MKNLDEVARDSWYLQKTAQRTTVYSYSIAKRFMSSVRTVLELGPAEGLVTELLVRDGYELTCVEGSKIFADGLRRFPEVQVIEGFFENVEMDKRFDFILLGHVLEHVDNPVEILSRIKDWLNPGGKIFCAVPNAISLHRLMAVEMGLIESVFSMSEKDVHHGHQRHYTAERLRIDFEASGCEIIDSGGYWAKMLPDSILDTSWTDAQLDASFKVGELIPTHAAELWVLAGLIED
jgi:2-polyprenyl-3-methyl-5-hydroxy-6-metoxy-1,4-benzoquinol methylase